jgi:DHA1 family bicyclomycin/chloramphenicol resistance-like MFS transporter
VTRASGDPNAVPLRVQVTLGILSAVGPVATNLYLPGFPDIAADLNVDEASVQLTLTGYMVGMAFGQLLLGALADRWGRVVPLLVSTTAATAASVVAVTTAELSLFVLMRFAQGFAAAGGIVISRAIVRDLATGVQAAKMFSLLMVVVGISPIVAPLAGGLLVEGIGWRGLMAIVAACFGASLLLALAFVRESLARGARVRSLGAAFANVVPLARNRLYLCYTLVAAFCFVMVFSFIGASSFVMQSVFGLGPQGYAMFFAVNGVGMLGATLLNRRLVGAIHPATIIGAGLVVQILATGTMSALALAGRLDVPALIALIVVATFTVPPLIANATALGLSAVKEGVGMASSLLGALQFGLGAVATGVASWLSAGSLIGMVLPMAVAAAAAGCAFAVIARRTIPGMHRARRT